MDSSEAMYSCSGAGPDGLSQGSTALTLSQWTSNSTTRSLSSPMLPAGSTLTAPSPEPAKSEILVLQASTPRPFTRTAHDPQMALRHEQRSARVPSTSSRILISPSSTVAVSSTSMEKSS